MIGNYRAETEESGRLYNHWTGYKLAFSFLHKAKLVCFICLSALKTEGDKDNHDNPVK